MTTNDPAARLVEAMRGLRHELEKMRSENFLQWLRYYDPVAYLWLSRRERAARP